MTINLHYINIIDIKRASVGITCGGIFYTLWSVWGGVSGDGPLTREDENMIEYPKGVLIYSSS